MRLVLQGRLLFSQSIPPGAVRSARAGFYQQYFQSTTTQGQSRTHTAKENKEDQLPVSDTDALQIRRVHWVIGKVRYGREADKRNGPDAPGTHARSPIAQEFDGADGTRHSPSTNRQDGHIGGVTQTDSHSSNAWWRPSLCRPIQDQRHEPWWRSRLMTFEQYVHESRVASSIVPGQRLVDTSYAVDWDLWLELITFRKRLYGDRGTIPLYREIIRRDLQMPTKGFTANHLWDLLIRAGYCNIELLEQAMVYAIRLKRYSAKSWSLLYYGFISTALRKVPDLAYDLHIQLKEDFPPSLEDYLKLFNIAAESSQLNHFSNIYKDTPLTGMYKTVIWHLCELQMHAKAVNWHDLLCEAKDFPTQLSDIQPLLHHLVYTGNKGRFEKVIKRLPKAKSDTSNVADHFGRENIAIRREIMNEMLGEVYGVAPVSLSDSFCARLFATRFFSVDTSIKGLHMMATETIGPLSLREIALRDNCDTGAICQHIDDLRAAGISLGNSVYCNIIRNLAVENKRETLQSIVNCDLHPNAFADRDLQERLLAQYYDEGDSVKIERTLVVLTISCSMKNLQLVRMNSILRCQITLGMREKVLATLEEMKRTSIPVTPRSSRHMRIHWLSRRQVGRGAFRTQELSILIQVSQMAMQSGRPVPIIVWREILRRLGMAGRLTELENLSLWLMDWRSSPVTNAAPRKWIRQSNYDGQAPIHGYASRKRLRKDYYRRSLRVLFTISAQHSIVAWGFQHSVSTRRYFRGFKRPLTEHDPSQLGGTGTSGDQWTWGLHLLHKLKRRGLSVQVGEIARVCRQRLNILFGTGHLNRKINRLARATAASESHSREAYVQKMEEIWGENLFRIRPSGRRKYRELRKWRIQFLNQRFQESNHAWRYQRLQHRRVQQENALRRYQIFKYQRVRQNAVWKYSYKRLKHQRVQHKNPAWRYQRFEHQHVQLENLARKYQRLKHQRD